MAALNITPADRDLIVRAVATEADHRLAQTNPAAYQSQVAGIVDTIMNRTASGEYPGTVLGVLDQKNQFSAINGPSGRGYPVYGSAASIPDDVVPDGLPDVVNEWINSRIEGTPSSVGGNLNYANPKFSDASNQGWISALDGPQFGAGNSVHRHGTMKGSTPVEAVVTGDFYNGQGVKLPPGYVPEVATLLDVNGNVVGKPRTAADRTNAMFDRLDSAPVPAPRRDATIARTKDMLGREVPVPAPRAQGTAARTNAALSQPVGLGGAGDGHSAAPPAAVRKLPSIPASGSRADNVGSMPTVDQVSGLGNRAPSTPPRQQAAAPSAQQPAAKPAGALGNDTGAPAQWADLNSFAKNTTSVPKYITETAPVPPASTKAAAASSPADIPLGIVVHQGSRDTVAQAAAGTAMAKKLAEEQENKPTRTVQRLNPDWVKQQKAAAAAEDPSQFGLDLGPQVLGAVRGALGIPAGGIGLGNGIVRGVQGALQGAFGLGQQGGKISRPMPTALSAQQIRQAQSRPQNQNAAAMAAISNGQKSYNASDGSRQPTVAMNGNVRNTYGD